jgi:hypothetical protein
MGFDFRFRMIDDLKDIRKLEAFLLKQPLNYRDYEDWVLRSMVEAERGDKKAILIFSDNILVGDLIYQRHKIFPRIREMKNARVHPELRDRYCTKFAVRQAEKENPEEFDAILCDLRSDQMNTINMLKSMGYEELLRAPIYDTDFEDVVMVRRFERTPTGFFVPIRNYITKIAC